VSVEQALWFIVGVLALIVGLGISIGLHEWGHFAPAKRFGVGITKFMVGFGPTVWSTQRGETEFGIKAIPLGGFVAMHGMFAPSESTRRRGGAGTDFAGMEPPGDEEAFDDSRSFYRLSVLRRIVVMLGGPFMNLVIATVLYAVLLMGFGIVQPSLTVGSVSECVLPATETRTQCEPGDPAAPGNQAGLRPGDVIVSVDGVAVQTWLELTEVIRVNPGNTITLGIEREGVARDIRITPLLTERYAIDSRGQVPVDSRGEPITEEVGFVGIGAALESSRQPVGQVPVAVWDNVVGVTNIILTLPQRMVQVGQAAFGDDERDPNGPISVVGVGRIAGEIASIDSIETQDRIASFLALLASLNIALFVFNLIPLLPLDGGHVAVALIDGIRRRFAKIRGQPAPRPTDPQRLMPLTLVVIAALISMSVLLMYADIVNPISLVQ
jgi:membrane-associated protease RseP (regulator of RpoE activity)